MFPIEKQCFLSKRASRSSETHLQASSSSEFSKVYSVSKESAAGLYTNCTFRRSRTINVFATTLALGHTSTQSHWHLATVALSHIGNQPQWYLASVTRSHTRIQAQSHWGTLALSHNGTQPHSQSATPASSATLAFTHTGTQPHWPWVTLALSHTGTQPHWLSSSQGLDNVRTKRDRFVYDLHYFQIKNKQRFLA